MGYNKVLSCIRYTIYLIYTTLYVERTLTAYIIVDSKLYDETVNYFMEHTDAKFICIERAFDTTMKFNLKNKMQDKLFAF